MRQIGPYQILDLLGKGGMGEVYLAEDTRLGRKVALKLFPSELTNDELRVLRFQQEARTASALNHPNILTIFDIGEVDSTHFIATEFVKGQTLRDCMSAGSINLQKTLNIVIQVASALGAAHEVGVVHRDIKPENIMVRPDGLVKVLDFGIAKLTQRTTTGGSSEMGLLPLVDTEPGMIMGTPKYMSPEQVRALDVDERTDIFSLGAVLHEMITGSAPFERPTVGDTIAAILQNEPPLIAQSATTAPAGLQEIVAKALRKDRDERYQAMGDLISDLRRVGKELETDQQSLSPIWTGDSPTIVTTTGKGILETRREIEGRSTRSGAASTASSAEYIVSELKQHKRGWALITAALVLTVAAVVYFTSGSGAIKSVAVLPFDNASNDPNTDYLSEGISESLINVLSGLPQLKVIARSSSFKYNGKQVDLQEVAKALNVQAIVTGRVMVRGDQLLISAQLNDTRDKTQMWGEQYNRKATDLQAVQEEIAHIISEKLRLHLTGTEEKLLRKHASQNEQAYQLYLNGVYYDRKGGIENKKKAFDYFNQAIAFDQEFALAYANAAVVYNILAENGVVDPNEARPKTKAAAQRALDLDDSLAEGHAAMALIKNGEWDWSGAENEYKRAIELNPNLALAHSDYAIYLSNMGRYTEALSENKRAEELDPLSIKFSNRDGLILQVARRYDEAIQQFQNVIKLQPDSSDAYIYLAYTFADKGMYPDAIAQYQKFISMSGASTSVQAYLGYAYAMAGKRNEALDLLNKLKTTTEYVAQAELAILYAGLGNKDEAFAALERAYAAHDPEVQYLKVEPHYDPLRSDPRFKDLLVRAGFTP
jgi:serine/threonine protein kinase/tetratricopeptide (TPR) repeat protein